MSGLASRSSVLLATQPPSRVVRWHILGERMRDEPGSVTNGPDLKGTDFISRTFGFVLDDILPILRSLVPWSIPIVMLALWPLVNPNGFAGDVVRALANLQATGRYSAGPTPLQWAFIVGSGILETILIAGFAAGQHRRVLHSVVPMERSLPEAVGPYAGYWVMAAVALSVIGFLYMMLLVLAAPGLPKVVFVFLIFAGMVFILAIALRGILVFPAIAVGDRSMTFERSFALTRRAIWRMLLSIIAIFLMVFVIYMGIGLIFSLVLSALSVPVQAIVITILQTVLEFISTAMFVTYVSLAYAHLAHGRTPLPSHW